MGHVRERRSHRPTHSPWNRWPHAKAAPTTNWPKQMLQKCTTIATDAAGAAGAAAAAGAAVCACACMSSRRSTDQIAGFHLRSCRKAFLLIAHPLRAYKLEFA